MTKPSLIVANWKMNKNISESLMFFTHLEKKLTLKADKEVVICPPFTSLYSISIAALETEKIKLGAQNCHWATQGAFTGEVSPEFLNEMECQYVILGHSERRHIFGETDEVIHKKIKSAFDFRLTPIFCVGETENQRNTNQTISVVESQLSKGLAGIKGSLIQNIVIAYEPVWAIGTGNTATPDQAQEVHLTIRNWIKKNYQEEIAQHVRILYGGSVKPDNIKDLMNKPDIDGALVGGASLEVDSFLEIVNYSET